METNTVEYHDHTTLLEGYYAYEETTPLPKPAVLIAHDWTGRSDFVCEKAQMFAKVGYLGFALDMFGKGVLGKNTEEKSLLISPFLKNRTYLLKRITLALNTLTQLPQVNPKKIAAVGYCFGGLCVLDLARDGINILGAVSMHGLLNRPEQKIKTIHAKILALHGYDDPMVPPDQVLSFADEMNAAGADWQIHMYGKTKHAFTNPKAYDHQLGTVYNKTADHRSWQTLTNFLEEIFA
jgi:dienelactone hydrolase